VKLSILDRFRRACRTLAPQDQAAVLRMILGLEGLLPNPQEHTGMGLRKLHPAGIWKVRVGLSLRALFRLADDEASLLFIGTHDEVKRFLRGL
jgi:mRNA-degrading endonuclease RelE of RelBE toxin-antitoxin system